MNKRGIKAEAKVTPTKSKTRALKGDKQDNNLKTIPVKTFNKLGGTFEQSKSAVNMKHHLDQVLKFQEEGISEVTALKAQIRKLTSMVETLKKERDQLTNQLQGKSKGPNKSKKEKAVETSSQKDKALCVIKLIKGEEMKLQDPSSKDNFSQEFGQLKSQKSTKSTESSKVEPKKPKTAYTFFSMVMNPKIKQEENLTFVETSKRVGSLWQGMDEDARKPYFDLYAIDLKRYEDQLMSFKAKGFFIQADGKKSPSHKATKKEKADLWPKQTISAYNFFTTVNLPKLMKGKLLSLIEASKENIEQWKKMSDTQKEPFIAKSQEDRTRRENQIKELKSKGYFTLSDGTKSCAKLPKDMISKVKKQAKQIQRKENSPIKEARKSSSRRSSTKQKQTTE